MRKIPLALLGLVLGLLVSTGWAQSAEPPDPPSLGEFRIYFIHLGNLDAAADKAEAEGTPGDTAAWRRFEQEKAGLTETEAALLKDVAFRCNRTLDGDLEGQEPMEIVRRAVDELRAVLGPAAFEAVSRRIQTFLRPAITNVPAAAIEGETAEDDEIPVEATAGPSFSVYSLISKLQDGSFMAQCGTYPNDNETLNQYAGGVTMVCEVRGGELTAPVQVPCGSSSSSTTCSQTYPAAPANRTRILSATHGVRMQSATYKCQIPIPIPLYYDPLAFCRIDSLPPHFFEDGDVFPRENGTPTCYDAEVVPSVCRMATSGTAQISWIYISPKESTVEAGGTVNFSTFLDATWSTDGPGTITKTGTYTARYTAPATVTSEQTVTIKGCDINAPGDCDTSTVTLKPSLQVLVSPTNRALPPTANLQLTATILPSSAGQELEWTATPVLGELSPVEGTTDKANYTVFRDDLIPRTTEVTIKACVKPALTVCGTAKVTVEKLLFMVTAPKTNLAPNETVQVTAFVGNSSVPRKVVWTDPNPGEGTLTEINPADPFIRIYKAPAYPVDFGINIEVCLLDALGYCAYLHIDLGSELTFDDISSDTGRWQAGVLTPFTITGTGFTEATEVYLSDLDVTLTSVTDTTIRGKVNIVVPATSITPRLKQANPFREKTKPSIPVEPATVSVVPPSAQVKAGGTVNLAASCLTSTVDGCTSLEIPSWTVSPAGTGTITGPGMLATYTAPATVPSSTTVTVNACWSFGQLSRCVPVQVTVLPNGPIVAVSPKTASVEPGKPQPFTAQVTNDQNTAVTWSISPQTGSITQDGVYTAPATFGGAATVTVTATSVADTSRKDTATVTLVPAPLTVTSTASPSWAHHGTVISWTATVSGGTPGTIQYALFRRVQGTTNWIPLLNAGAWQTGNVLTWTPGSTDVATWEIRVGVRDANNAGPVLHDPGSVQVIAPLVVTCPTSPASVDYGTTVTWTIPTSGGLPGTIRFAFFRRRAGTTPWTPDVTAPVWQASNVLTWTPAAADVGSWEFYVWVKDGTTPPNANGFGYTFGCNLGTIQVLAPFTVTSTASPASVNHGTAISWTATANGGSGTGREYAVVRRVAGTTAWSAPAWQTSNVLGWTPGPADVGTWEISVWVKDSLTPAGSSFGASYNPGSVQVRVPLTVTCTASPAYATAGTAINWTATASGGTGVGRQYALFRLKHGTSSWIPNPSTPAWQPENALSWTPGAGDVGTWTIVVWFKDANTPANANGGWGYETYCNPGVVQVVAPLTLTSNPSPAAAYSGQPITWTLATTGGVPGTIQYTWSRRRSGTADWISSGWLTDNVITWTPSSAEAGSTWEIAFTVKDSLTTPTQNGYGFAAWHNPGPVQVFTPPAVTCTASPASATYGTALSWTATVSGGSGVNRQYAFFRRRSGTTPWTPDVTVPAWQAGNVMTWTPGSGDAGAWDTYIWVKDSATPASMSTYGYAAGCNPGGVQIVAPLGVTSTASPALATHGNAVNWTATATGGVAASTQFAVVRRVSGTTAWSAPVWQTSNALSWTPASTDVNTWEISIWVRDGNTPAGGYAASYNPGNVRVVDPLSVTGTSSPAAYYHSNPITWTATGSGGTGVGRQYALFRLKQGTSTWIPDVTAPAWQTSNVMTWTPAPADVGTWQIVVWFKDANTPSNANGYGYGAYYVAGLVQVYAHPTVSGTGSPASVSYGTPSSWTATGSGGIGSAKQYALFRKKVGTANWIPAITSPAWQTGNVMSWTPGSADVGTWEIVVWMKDANTPATMNGYGYAAYYNAGPVEVTGPLSLSSCTPSPVSSTYGNAISWTAYASGGHAPTIQYAFFRKRTGSSTWIPAQTSPAWQSGSVMSWTPGSGDVGGWDISIWIRDGNTPSGYAASCSPGTVQVTAPLGLSVTATPSSAPYGSTITWTATASGGYPPTTKFALFRRRPGTGNSGWIPSIYSPAWQSSRTLTWTPTESEVGVWEIYFWVKDGSTPPTQNTYGYAAGVNGGAVEITAPIYQYYEPIGWVDGVDNQWIWGWACDPDYPWQSNRVDIWSTSWEYLGSADASDWSSAPINNACGGGSAHYFSFYHRGSIPSGTHFWVWSIDLPYATPGGVNVPIGGFNGSNEFVMP